MQKRHVIALIRGEVLENEPALQEWEALSQSYPWCSTLRTIYTALLHRADSLAYDAQLPLAAIHIQDRTKLYDFVSHKQATAQKVQAPAAQEWASVSNSDAEAAIDGEEPEAPPKVAALGDSFTAVHTSAAAKVAPIDALDRRIQEEAVLHLGEMQAALLEKAEISETSEGEPPSTSTSQPTGSYAHWLQRVDSASNSTATAAAIIDKFILTNPQISPLKSAFFSPMEMGKQSLMEDPEVVTETLAKIYSQQGDFKRAARAYETLALKNPQKRLYFAGLQKEAEAHLKRN